MKSIAIVHNADSFSEHWISYCNKQHIPYHIVNPYASDIIQQVQGCTAFMWHFYHLDYRDMQCAKKIILSLEAAGIICFPNSKSCWHFNDKVAEKYLLEAIGAPLVPSYVFYSKEEALSWAKNTTFPKVFKLKGGAGSSNVKLVHNYQEAKALIHKCFGIGFRQYRWKEVFQEARRKYKNNQNTLRDVLRPFKQEFLMKYPTDFDHYHQKDIGYAYFQDFIPNNTFDIRICVIGDKAFGSKRLVRENDFRASGSGYSISDKNQLDERCVRIAFDVSKKLGTQSLAYDFVFDENNRPLIVEISYGFPVKSGFLCEGFWTSDMVWHEGPNFDFCGWMVENLMK